MDLEFKEERQILGSAEVRDINATGVRERYRHGKIRVEKIALEHLKL